MSIETRMPALSNLRIGRRLGFTLIELMVVVVILGVLAAIALPAFGGYLKITKTSEATGNLNNIFKSAATFYAIERTGKGMSGNTMHMCVVGPTGLSPAVPTNSKSVFKSVGGFQQLGFTIADYVYYGYGIDSIGTVGSLVCSIGPNRESVYTLYAHGDLDADLKQSTFSLVVGTDDYGQLFHSRGFYVQSPIE
jgi:prepilin-type N-terminal cleavage/methylation domain-containing protein